MEPTNNDVAPVSYDHAIGMLLTICDNLIFALEYIDHSGMRISYTKEARSMMRRIDYRGWQKAGKVFSYDGVPDAPVGQ